MGGEDLLALLVAGVVLCLTGEYPLLHPVAEFTAAR